MFQSDISWKSGNFSTRTFARLFFSVTHICCVFKFILISITCMEEDRGLFLKISTMKNIGELLRSTLKVYLTSPWSPFKGRRPPTRSPVDGRCVYKNPINFEMRRINLSANPHPPCSHSRHTRPLVSLFFIGFVGCVLPFYATTLQLLPWSF